MIVNMIAIWCKVFVISTALMFAKIDVITNQCSSSSSSSRSMSDSDCYLSHLARENVIRMGQEGGCDVPKQQIVYPQDPSKTYMPRGTIMYRCNDQAGCCPQKEHSCQAVGEEELRVAFYAIDCSSGDSRPTPEYVRMKNHTKCLCQPKSDDGMHDRGMSTPQRLVDSLCGQQSRRGGGGGSSYGSSGGGSGYGSSGGGSSSSRSRMMYDLTHSKPFYGDPNYGQPLGVQSSYGQSPAMQTDGYRQTQQSQTQPCRKDGQSSRPLVDGQIVRGTIRVIVSGADQSHHQQGCPYG